MTNALLHPFSPPAMPEGDFIDIVRGEGSLVYDASGKDYVDAMANLWLCQVGHGRTEIIDAVTAQMHQMEAYNTFAPFTNGPAARVAEMIVERSPHPDGRTFLGCSGSEAVDTALKIARLVQQRRGTEGRQVIIKRTNGYHGTNFGGTSAQGIAPNREGWGDLVPHFLEVPHDDLEAMASIFAEQGDRIAAVLTEPLQGAGGVFPPADGYLEGLRRLCDDNGALLIFDEVICGFGRTGEWFGAQTFGVTPDLITFAKGVTSGYLPLSGVIVSRAVCEELEEPGFLLRTGYTYSGHHASCAAGIANLQIMTDEGLDQRANHVGEKLQEGLRALAADGHIESWRGMGAVYAAELGRDSIPVRNAILEEGVIVRPIGTCLAICPPLVITDDEIGRVIDTLANALR
ncbi:MAG: aminotransferase class III-fold pyridoxal phosphate-dependent enzyme [Acidimicrobiales bacterium]|jgi:adenosylmethionine-8-amino-7-oxononanoate aminotransferase|nr:aspartate aminotransferase family protein [Acidimicrobiaceae bacterium]MCP4852464.1 aspartate aminotransferase family protein [Actinomycetes bacterium]MDP6159253.1 aminotransferase class III-fold pyridoxal phosphate-dependent enzyme [Acidimicrobiales bacterium]MDP6286399.1 aminotransferase class III-fold pyridoxal phosphate-dependent enzyme [Acidimicrobiales bacterium]MDP6910357.1 aminotransferase class III-fold pyridoxal phosphate-dependent enzyme [Acidimicrobiales bacterium]